MHTVSTRCNVEMVSTPVDVWRENLTPPQRGVGSQQYGIVCTQKDLLIIIIYLKSNIQCI